MCIIINEVDYFGINVSVLRSSRKSIVGRVLPNGSIEVRAPLTMTTEKIREWLGRFEPKFLPIVRLYHEMNAYISEHPFGYGGEVLFMGDWIPVKQAEDDNGGYMARYRDGAVIMKPGLSEDDMRHRIMDLFSSTAVAIFEKKLRHYAGLMGVGYRAWSIGNARKRHGSCDSGGKITLSWLILMMGEPVIELIIVHELAHLKQMNHSKAFRDEVAAVLPDWRERQKEHARYGHILHCCGWI